MTALKQNSISLAGWPLRHFTLKELVDFLALWRPRLVEISKDFIRDGVSLKELALALERNREPKGAALAYAGTTDLLTCSGFSWDRYRSYLTVQVSEAKFLQCSLFRLMVGKPSPQVGVTEIIRRIQDFCSDIAPMDPCIEIHGGVESDLGILPELLRAAPLKIVIDLENMHRARLSTDQLLEVIPLDRVAYFHQRNLPAVWIEHSASLEAESRWHAILPDADFLWEPKTVDDPKHIQELFHEYRTSS